MRIIGMTMLITGQLVLAALLAYLSFKFHNTFALFAFGIADYVIGAAFILNSDEKRKSGWNN